MSRSAASRFPSHLTFDHDPTDQDVQQLVGPDVAVRRVLWAEDDREICVVPPRFPFKRSVFGVLLMLAAMNAAPWGISLVSKNPVGLTTLHIVVFAILWGGIAPVALILLVRARRRVDALEPGAIVTKQTRDLALPGLDRVVSAQDIVRFVDVRGRFHVRGAAAFLRQCGVIFRDGERFVFAPIARLLAPSMRKSCAARLADHYDVPVQEVSGVTFPVR